MNPNIEQSIDVYSLVTNRIIELLEAGTVPWQKPWTTSGIPRNVLSKRPYGGINLLLLNALNYDQNLFLTWKQIKTIGGSVIKGEKGHLVIFTKMIETEEMGKNNKPKMKPFLRYYKVFNIRQCKDIPAALIPTENELLCPVLAYDLVVENMPNKPPIVVKEKQAFYDPQGDFINMPKIKSFKSVEMYYGVLFHELIHSTGHQSRLNRKEVTSRIVFGGESYSLEELTAEMGACFLKSHCGINIDDLSNNAAYIQNWLEQLRNDKRFIIHASARAQKAVEYILNEKVEGELKDKQDESLIDENALELLAD
jgi:antirestriction protein ArdC